MKIFVINLEKDIERKKSIQEQLQNLKLDFEFINAIYGKNLNKEQLQETCPCFEKMTLTLGELGCSLSHLNAYKKIIDHQIPISLILEDDASLNTNLKNVLSSLERHPMTLSSTPYVFLLSKTNEYFDSFKKKLGDSHHIVSVIDAACTHGYALNLSAASKLYGHLFPVKFVADEWKMLREQGIIKLKGVIPPVITISSHGAYSSIGKRTCVLTKLDKMNRKKNIFIQIKLTLWRVFIRTWLKKIRP
ncbi:glycosyltransferase family 25 protein [Xenorhabdus thailandensis]|uniref:glycosyltransferase family 25 protein n=1 Tax=Xenorhabdus thailandensis TaxID=3136255 RepID=UPI0030F49BAE